MIAVTYNITKVFSNEVKVLLEPSYGKKQMNLLATPI